MNLADGDFAAGQTEMIALDTMDTSNAFTQTKTHHQFTKEKPLMPYITVGQENSANIDIYYEDLGTG